MKIILLAVIILQSELLSAETGTGTPQLKNYRQRLVIPGCSGKCGFCSHNGVHELCHGPCVGGTYIAPEFSPFQKNYGGYCLETQDFIPNCDMAFHDTSTNAVTCYKCSEGYAPVFKTDFPRECWKFDSSVGLLDPNALAYGGKWDVARFNDADGNEIEKYYFNLENCKFGYYKVNNQIVEGLGTDSVWNKCEKNEHIPPQAVQIEGCESYRNTFSLNSDYTGVMSLNGVICDECKVGYKDVYIDLHYQKDGKIFPTNFVDCVRIDTAFRACMDGSDGYSYYINTLDGGCKCNFLLGFWSKEAFPLYDDPNICTNGEFTVESRIKKYASRSLLIFDFNCLIGILLFFNLIIL